MVRSSWFMLAPAGRWSKWWLPFVTCHSGRLPLVTNARKAVPAGPPGRYNQHMLTADPATWDWSRPVFDHVHLRVADLAASRAFYGALLEPLDIPLLLDTPHLVGFANLALSDDGEPSAGVHLCFTAPSREAVEAFHAAGLAAGGRDNGPPGPRPYGPYSAYVIDPDGTNVEAAHRVWPAV